MKIIKMKRATLTLAALTLLLGSTGSASATPMTFDLAWSGASFENSAVATGQITFDPSLLNNPGTSAVNDGSFAVTAFSLVVSGASSGNGTFGLADYAGSVNSGGMYLDTGGNTLDFTDELVGQTTGGNPPWDSTPGALGSGDFNIFGNGTNPAAPSGTFYFQLTTSGGSGDTMNLTSFTPTPEPSGFILCGLGALGLLAAARRRRKVEFGVSRRGCDT